MLDKHLFDKIKFDSKSGEVVEASALFSFNGETASQTFLNVSAQGIISGCCEVTSDVDTVKTPGSYRMDAKHPLFSQGLIVKKLEQKDGEFTLCVILVSPKKEKQKKPIKIVAQKVSTLEMSVPVARLNVGHITPRARIANPIINSISRNVPLVLEKEHSLNNMLNIYQDCAWAEKLPSAAAFIPNNFSIESKEEFVAKKMDKVTFVRR